MKSPGWLKIWPCWHRNPWKLASLLRIQVTLPRSGAKCYSLWLFVEWLMTGSSQCFCRWFFLKFWVKMNDMTIYLDGFTIFHCHISHGIFETRSFPVWHRVIWPLVGLGNALCITCSVHHKTQEVWKVCYDFYYCMYSLGASPTH